MWCALEWNCTPRPPWREGEIISLHHWPWLLIFTDNYQDFTQRILVGLLWWSNNCTLLCRNRHARITTRDYYLYFRSPHATGCDSLKRVSRQMIELQGAKGANFWSKIDLVSLRSLRAHLSDFQRGMIKEFSFWWFVLHNGTCYSWASFWHRSRRFYS